MCGILGGIWSRDDAACDGNVDRALGQLARRGPDARGSVDLPIPGRRIILGHTRLAVIDLGPGGRQPMHAPDGRCCIVFNGEIYNFRELRDELVGLGHSFVSQSDTEVLLHCWMQWGAACLPRLVGMFAFAVYDRTADELTCVRDPFGIKPLFYRRDGADFVFASELPAVRTLLDGGGGLNRQRACDYLLHGDYDSSEQTFLEGVLHLPPGHLLRVRTDRPAAGPVCWWRPRVEPVQAVGFVDAAAELRGRLLESVRLHLRSDVPLGVTLSGGIDSSTIACAIRHLEPDLPIHTFSYVARGSTASEEPWIDRVNAHVGAVAHKVEVSSRDLARDLDDMIVAQGEPFGSTSIYAQYRVFKLARERGVTVTLDGQGADELTAGYAGHPGRRLRSLLDAGRPLAAASFLRHWARWPDRSLRAGLRALVDEFVDGAAFGGRRGRPPAWIDVEGLRAMGVRVGPFREPSSHDRPGRRLAAALASSIACRGLPALLRHGDRNAMRFSVESRVPFLTTDLADFLLTLPEDHLLSSRGETKRILRAAMRGIVPDAVLDRRDKVGFATPEFAWLKDIASQVRDWLAADVGPSFLRRDVMLAEFDAVMAGRRPFSWTVWRWINFTRWYAHFFAGAVA
jgi:asparagine synthase (glutamine-hydrolysing)